MQTILHSLTSTFTTCACGSRTRDCALTLMSTFVDAPSSATSTLPPHADPDPLVGHPRGFRARERIPQAAGLASAELDPSDVARAFRSDPAPTANPTTTNGDRQPARKRRKLIYPPMVPSESIEADAEPRPAPRVDKGKGRAVEGLGFVVQASEVILKGEEQMPPKMRKRWMHVALELLKVSSVEVGALGERLVMVRAPPS